MFFTAIQNARDNSWVGVRFVSFEADSESEARERAEWFGLDFQAIAYGWEGTTSSMKRWYWHIGSCNTRAPEVAGTPIERSTSIHRGYWMVVYRNGNLRSNNADSFAV